MFFRRKQKQARLKERTKQLILKERADIDHANAVKHLSMRQRIGLQAQR